VKVVFHEDFKSSYTMDPAAADGRMEAIWDVIGKRVTFVKAVPAGEEDIAAVHTKYHIDDVRRMGIYDVAALAAGGAIQAATIGLEEPCFALTPSAGTPCLRQHVPGVSAISTTCPLPWRSSEGKGRSKRPMSWT